MPVCPKCGKQMKKKEQLSFTYALEIAIENAIRSAGSMPPKPTEWACVGKQPCKQHAKWQEMKKRYDKEMQMRDKVIKENEKRLLLKKKVPPMPKPLPPEPPKQVPCINHWEMKDVITGPASVEVKKRRPKQFFLCDEITGMLSRKKGLF